MQKNNQARKIPETLRHYMGLDNIAQELDGQTLSQIVGEVIDKGTEDDGSRYDWKDSHAEALKIAKQVVETKNTPWEGASNIKYPVITSACIQFNARTYPEVIQGNNVVHIADLNEQANELEEDRNDRIAKHMSWQLLEQVQNWERDTDKLLMVLGLAGVVYRKSYFDPIDKKPAVEFCLPTEIIVHDDISSLTKAQRITHVLHMTDNEIIEKMRAGIYLDYPINELQDGDAEGSSDQTTPETDAAAVDPSLHEVWEQHTYLDLDDDGYKEPYIVTIHKEAQVMLRIVARYDKDSFVYTKNSKEFVKINPIHFFTDYHYMPSPDGKFHSMGLGSFLYPLNEAINTSMNQMIDAATLQNRGGGFINSSLKMSPGPVAFKLGEYKKVIPATGTTLAQSVFPMPAPGPSPTLFTLLQMLTTSAKELASVTDVMQGQMPGPNAPVGTTMSVIEQGTKVYSAILKRLFPSFKSEFQKLFDINKRYLDVEESFIREGKMLNITLADYRAANVGIFPVLDPSVASDAHRSIKAQAILQLAEQNPEIDKREALIRYLEALKIPHPEKLLPEPDPNAPPTPEQQLMEAEVRYKNMQAADIPMRRELEAMRIDIENQNGQRDGLYKGGMMASAKIDSITKLVETEAKVGKDLLDKAHSEFDLLERQEQYMMPAGDVTQQQLSQMEAALQPQAGDQPQPSPADSQGAASALLEGAPPAGQEQPQQEEQINE